MFHVTVEHQGRELVHGMQLLARCLRIPNVPRATRERWQQEIRKAQADLELLYAGRLRRDFLHPPLGPSH